ncbi:DUF4434 domain-containing protein [Pseudidiomarina sp. E22-M8]|uniref:DUF4434 domain-containing protein n=1 Tax=Pseudidiomarina sp. E22-M8 TaxID=3424768 RepID=UPI00403C2BE1
MTVQAQENKNAPALGVMYQPLNRDAELGGYGWNYLFQQLTRTDIEFGVVQWLQYGNERFNQPTPWLSETLTIWQRHMPLWLGLHTEPDYFNAMAAGEAAQQQFFDAYLRTLNGAVAPWQTWITQHQNNFLGWYVPLELSDAYFTAASERQQLHEFLHQLKQRLGSTPLAISVFMSATMPADEFGVWLNELQQLGYQVWLQDGVGTQALSDKQRETYFARINCQVVLINEVFVQTSKQPFAARSARADELARVAARQPACHQRILFSLRYLPETAGLLYLTDINAAPTRSD